MAVKKTSAAKVEELMIEDGLLKVASQEITDRYALYCGDCCQVMPTLREGSIHGSIYSPPFGGLYQYSSDVRDLSNALDYDQFFRHYEYVVREIFRLTMPGRMSIVHCMYVPRSNSGTDSYLDFPGDITRLHQRNGFDLASPPIQVWKEPLAVRNRTMAKNLAHKSIVEDSCNCAVAGADYLLVFRKKGKNPIPVTHQNGLLSYAGERKMPAELLRYKGWKGNQIQNRYSHWIWRQYASAFWDDVRIKRVLPFKESRDEEDEKHVHPLQLDVIERCLTLWSNPGETILTPFMGVGSEIAGAVVNGRRGIGIELKPSYYRQAVKNLAKVEPGSWGDATNQEELSFDEPAALTDSTEASEEREQRFTQEEDFPIEDEPLEESDPIVQNPA